MNNLLCERFKKINVNVFVNDGGKKGWYEVVTAYLLSCSFYMDCDDNNIFYDKLPGDWMEEIFVVKIVDPNEIKLIKNRFSL